MAVAQAQKRRVTFKLVAPEAEQVILSGSFNGWTDSGTLLKRDAKGVWKAQVSLEPGRYEYRFRVDGHWRDDPECMNRTPNEFGSENCIREVTPA
jgi:1,4-alpha-glucan branching enzyme